MILYFGLSVFSFCTELTGLPVLAGVSVQCVEDITQVLWWQRLSGRCQHSPFDRGRGVPEIIVQLFFDRLAEERWYACNCGRISSSLVVRLSIFFCITSRAECRFLFEMFL